MNEEKRARLQAAGFKIGTVAEFLELTPEENALVEIKLAETLIPSSIRRDNRCDRRGVRLPFRPD